MTVHDSPTGLDRTSQIEQEYAAIVRDLSNGLRPPLRGAPSTSPDHLASALRDRLSQVEEADRKLRELERRAMQDVDNEWPRQLTELRLAVRTDIDRGIRACLVAAVEAASRADAGRLTDLLSEGLLPGESASVLGWRLSRVRAALQAGPALDAIPFLELATASGSDLGVPPEVLGRLAILAARIELDEGSADRALSMLDRAAKAGAGPGEIGLVRAWQARKSGEHLRAAELIQAATAKGADLLAVLVEQIHVTRAEGPVAGETVEAATATAPAMRTWQLAESEIWSVGPLDDVETRLHRLIEPTPPEIWAAIASRAWAEGDGTLAMMALQRARADMPAVEYWAHARLAELAATIDEQRGNADDADAFLVLAANNHTWAGNFDEAALLFERVVARQPNNRDASLGLADVINVKTSLRPLGEVLDDLIRARTLVTSVEAAIDDGTSWGYAVLAMVEGRLASVLGVSGWAHSWGAVRAAALGVVFQPIDADRWAALSGALSDVDLDGAAGAAASIA